MLFPVSFKPPLCVVEPFIQEDLLVHRLQKSCLFATEWFSFGNTGGSTLSENLWNFDFLSQIRAVILHVGPQILIFEALEHALAIMRRTFKLNEVNV